MIVQGQLLEGKDLSDQKQHLPSPKILKLKCLYRSAVVKEGNIEHVRPRHVHDIYCEHLINSNFFVRLLAVCQAFEKTSHAVR